jgi:hypothetical protein
MKSSTKLTLFMLLVITILMFSIAESHAQSFRHKHMRKTIARIQRKHAHNFHGCVAIQQSVKQHALYASKRRKY